MKLKDYVTLGNLLCGMAVPVALMHHRFDLGCYLIILGWVFDALDGAVARLTKQFNKFGGELDNLCDLVTYSVAPGFLIFYAFYYVADYHIVFASAIAFLPVAVGTVRAARYNVRRAEFPGFFIGLPRTAFALVMVALLQSSLFQFLGRFVSTYLYLIPAAIIIIISYLLMSTRPFIGHHSHKWGGLIRFGIWWFVISIPVGVFGGWLLFGYPGLVFDVLLFDLLVYMLLGNLAVPPKLLAEVKAYVKEWEAMGEESHSSSSVSS